MNCFKFWMRNANKVFSRMRNMNGSIFQQSATPNLNWMKQRLVFNETLRCTEIFLLIQDPTVYLYCRKEYFPCTEVVTSWRKFFRTRARPRYLALLAMRFSNHSLIGDAGTAQQTTLWRNTQCVRQSVTVDSNSIINLIVTGINSAGL